MHPPPTSTLLCSPTRRSSDLHWRASKPLRLRPNHGCGSSLAGRGADWLYWKQDRGRRGTGNGKGSKDRKSTRLNSSHLVISYAVFCLTKKWIDTAYMF